MARVPKNTDLLDGQNDQTSFNADPIIIKQIDELSPAQRKRVDYVMRSICPQGNIIGVMVAPRSWDLRPFVQVTGEPEPSMIRFIGPEVALAPKIEDRVKRVKKYLLKLQDRQQMSRDWGELEGQLWYRRKLIDRTFEDLLIERKSFSLDEAIALSVQTAEEIVKFHLLDVYHGHITPQNIAIDRNGSVVIIDKTIGISIVQASKMASNNEYPQGYILNSFAPELLQSEDLPQESDFYGFGRVFQLIFAQVNTDYFSDDQTLALADIKQTLARMTSKVKSERPSFSEYFSLLSSLRKTDTEAIKLDVDDNTKKPIPTGKVIQTKKAPHKVPFNIGDKKEFSSRAENNVQRQVEVRRDNPKPQNIPTKAPVAPGFQIKVQEQKKEPKKEQNIQESIKQEQKKEQKPFEQIRQQPSKEQRPIEQHQTEQKEKWLAQEQNKPEANKIILEQKQNKVEEIIAEPVKEIKQENPVDNKVGEPPPPLKRPRKRPTADFRFIDEVEAFIVDDVAHKKKEPKNESPDDFSEEVPSDYHVEIAPRAQPSEARLSNRSLFVIVIAIAFLVYYLFGPSANVSDDSYDSTMYKEYSNEELQSLWSSALPSKMTNVIAAAINPVRSNPQAEQLIIASAMRNEDVLPGFRYDLIRIAFNAMWEAELNANDRRAAMVLASAKMRIFKNPPLEGLALDKLHPAILFATTAAIGKDAGQFLSQTPAKEFERLPVPISSAFVVLNAMYPNLSCGDERIRMLAQIITGGYNNAQLVSKFVQDDPLIKLQALAQAFSLVPDQARSVLGIVLSHPNLQLKDANADWARKYELLRWAELDANDQLLLLAGIPPQKDIEPTNIAKMFAHPSPEVRSAAIGKAIDTIKFAHPGAIEVLSILKESPELMDANQTVRLAQFLENPAQTNNKAVRESVIAWLKTNPKPELLIKMLVASSVSQKPTMLDFEISRYVQEKGWRPTVDELRKLVVHPEQFTRLFSYSETFLIPDRNVAIEILKKALKHETDPRFKAQIEENLSKLKAPK